MCVSNTNTKYFVLCRKCPEFLRKKKIHPEKRFFNLKKYSFAMRLKKQFLWFKYYFFKTNKNSFALKKLYLNQRNFFFSLIAKKHFFRSKILFSGCCPISLVKWFKYDLLILFFIWDLKAISSIVDTKFKLLNGEKRIWNKILWVLLSTSMATIILC